METQIYSIEELKNFFIQELINKADGKVSKVTDHSVLNGTAFGVAKIFQKGMKDVALLESELFPEYAYGDYLDIIALRYGIVGRRKNSYSTVHVKLVAEPGSLYVAENCLFVSTEGVTFQLLEDFEMGENGYDYVELRSTSMGEDANVGVATITKVTNGPLGHIYVCNDLAASGGVSVEDDQSFLNRIIGGFNNFSFETIDKLVYVMQTINQNVLSAKKIGVNSLNQTVISVISANGGDFTEEELGELNEGILPYLSLADLVNSNSLSANYYPVILQNIEYTYIDFDFRCELYSDIDENEWRISCQEALADYLDFRYWEKEKVYQEDLYYIVKGISGIKSLPLQYFTPGSDISISSTSLPRIRGWVMRDLNGAAIQDNGNNILPLYYGPDYTKNVIFEINSELN